MLYAGPPKNIGAKMSHFLEDHLSYFACSYDQMKPVTRKILHKCLMYFETKKKEGEIDDIFPSIKTIAKISKCGTTSVKKSLKEIIEYYPNILKITKKIGKRSNHYELNEKMYEFLALIQACRYDYRWKEVRSRVLINLSEDEEYLAKIICRKDELSTMKVSTSQLSKVSTIKSSLKNFNSINFRTEERAQFMNNFEDKSKQKPRGYIFIRDLPMTEKDKLYFSQKYLEKDLRYARDDYDWYSLKKQKTIYNPAGFFQSMLKRHAKY